MKWLEDFLNENIELGINAAFLIVGGVTVVVIFLLEGNTVTAWQGMTALLILFGAVKLKFRSHR